jgi:hypothetical protein
VIGCLQALEAIKVAAAVGEPLCGRMLLFDALAARIKIVCDSIFDIYFFFLHSISCTIKVCTMICSMFVVILVNFVIPRHGSRY